MKDLDYYRLLNFAKADKATHLTLVQGNVSGGRIARQEVDAIGGSPEATEIAISGLKQDTFEYFIEKYGRQFRAIHFWKCPLVTDLTALESLPGVEYILWFWNQRTEKLWDLAKSKSLKGLSIDDFTRLHDLSGMERAPALSELHFGNIIWNKYVVNTLEPIGDCTQLRRLDFSANKIVDGRVEPLGRLQGLERLGFPSNQFTTEQVAWLKAHLPPTVQSDMLKGHWMLNRPIHMGGKDKDTGIVGKRKPLLDSTRDRKAIERYIAQFEAMYAWFLSNPAARPEDYQGD